MMWSWTRTASGLAARPTSVRSRGEDLGRLSRRRTEHENGVQAAEGERVRHGVAHIALLADIRRVVEIAFWVGLVEPDRRWDESLSDCLDRSNSFDAAARSKAMAMHRLGRRNGELVGGVAEHALDGARLVDVVDRGRRAVRVYVIDVGRSKSRIVKRLLHGHRGAVDRRVDHVGRVGG